MLTCCSRLRITARLLALHAVALEANAEPLGLDRPATLMGPEVGVLDSLRTRQASGDAELRFGTITAERGAPRGTGWNLGNDGFPLWLTPLSGMELRTVGDSDQAFVWEAGARIQGRKDSLRFFIDARIFAERHTENRVASWDGEVVDRSTEGELSNATFTSFSRYRGFAELATPVGLFGFRREPLHWGPGRRGNLVFNQDAIPFPHFYWEGDFGNASIEAIWGRLTIDGIGDYRRTHDTRSVYGHRYEWRPISDLALGVSEMMLLYNQESPAGLVPFVPLFIEKGEVAERENNGNLAFDAAFRRWNTLFYGEFLIDDMQEPSSLFSDNYWGNRWAALAGVFWTHAPDSAPALSIGLEWTRVEPWVYTHFAPNTAQALNMGRPIGNQDGPNSESILLNASIRKAGLGASAGIKALWKGVDSGSSATDIAGKIKGKTFLANVDDMPDWIPEASLWKQFSHVQLHGSYARSRSSSTARVRILAWY